MTGQINLFFPRWDQMWLNEGFAEYVSNIASHSIDPEIHTWERWLIIEMQKLLGFKFGVKIHF